MGKMTRLELNQRAGAAVMPKIHLIDLKIAQKQNGMSQSLIDEIQKRLDKKEQVLVFLNRRGYAPVLICESCAWQAKCPHCDANFTVHRQPYQHLHCHHCGSIHRLPEQCPQCKHSELKPIGLGTAKVEENLQQLFPHFDVIRVDRDSTSRVGSWQKIYDKIQKSEPVILLGTQMLAKGHHFPYVTLVAILDIDSGLLSVDFRATERTAQLIVQVAGRAGRGERKGEVYLQTLRPDHPLLNTLIDKDYRHFARQTLKERQAAALPPFRYAALIRCESKSQEQNQEFLQQHAQALRQVSENLIDIWGPIPAPMERKAGRYQAHMVLLSQDRARLHFYIRAWWQNMLHQKPSTMKLTLDIDPQELS
jgi:primosomal protein N' (replication factor Y)